LCTLREGFLDLILAGSFTRRSKIRSSGEAGRTTSQTSDIVFGRLLRQEILAARHFGVMCRLSRGSSLARVLKIANVACDSASHVTGLALGA
jgi:hypothetical protein